MGTRKLRKNFYVLFAGLGLFISLTVCAVMYLQFRDHIKTSYFGILENVAKMVERQYPIIYDIDTVKQGILNDEDWFWDLHRKWNEIVEAFDLAYIYFIEKNEENNYVFVIDTYFTRDHESEWLGTLVWEDHKTPSGVDEAWDSQEICFSPYPSHEEYWGVLVSALLPVVINGETVGLLGVDYDISYVNALEQRVFFFLFLAFIASVVLTALLAFIGSRSVIVSIEEREQIAREANERRLEIENLMGALKTASDSRNAFLSKISKEMADPINDIIRLSSLIYGKEDINDDLLKNLELINDSGTILYDVINNIMDILKIEAGELKLNHVKYKLQDLIHSVTSQYAILAEDRPIKYKLNIDEKLPLPELLMGDALRIRLICQHLLNNAFRFTSKGVISVNISCKWKDVYVWLIIKVSDTGIGIAEEKLKHIFAGYGQIDAVEKFRSGGTGLGLYISKQLVDLMKGTLSITSELGKGSVFTLCLPQKLLSEKPVDPEIIKKLVNLEYSSK